MGDDLISRQAAIDALEKKKDKKSQGDISGFYNKIIQNDIDTLMLLPTADRPQGEWKHLGGDEWLCSNCGHVVWTEGSWEHPLERGKDYCEHCGADMRGEK